MRRSRILPAGLALAFMPGTCTMLDVGLGSGPLDGIVPIKSVQLFLAELPPDEPVHPPDGSEPST